MKKIILLSILTLTTTDVFAQDPSKKDSSNYNIERKQRDTSDVYELFPTQNIWTFIKLNTRNGKMWQVQFSVKDIGIVIDLNSIALVSNGMEVNGRFTLYPTENIWTFILLDQISGDTWQVQWSNEDGNRGIINIK
ncbi:hypothetical protein [Flavobacterium humi]|uniref:Uncharacterized protein n=1 Tax=Flavobacterium humi TaxID=2562683 RepID=A0A4Z0L2X2_9FLAO|nr:hypothetical protein [Flavobacterium humi]TGD56674.1 hypothetical protein E4635_14625 [Flavobacterium humi]